MARLLAVAVALALAAAIPPAAGAAPAAAPEFRDTASASGDNFVVDDFSVFDIEVQASSGPSGEDPSGRVTFTTFFNSEPVSGPVSCLHVAGNRAVLTADGPFASFPGVLAFTVTLVDNGGSGLDRFQYYPVLPEAPEYVDCTLPPLADFGGPLIGRASVFDAPPPPATRADCAKGAFARFGFRNQGQCVRFVSHG